MKCPVFVRCLGLWAALSGALPPALQTAAAQATTPDPHYFGTTQPDGRDDAVPATTPAASAAVRETPDTNGPTGSQQSIRAPFVGLWNGYVARTKMHTVTLLSADGTWSEDGRRQGTWEVTGTQLVLHLSNKPSWSKSFALPIQEGRLLEGTDTQGSRCSLSLRSAAASDADYAAVVGSWVHQDVVDGSQATLFLRADGSWTNPEKGEVGIWYIQKDMLRMSRNGEPHLETYHLPGVDGVLRGGSNKTGHAMTLTRAGGNLAVIGQATPAPVVPSRPAAPSAPVSPAGDLPSATLRSFLDTNLGAILGPLDAPGFSRPVAIAEIKANFADGMARGPSGSAGCLRGG
jgi:hypothetical protein